jgi:hypothetical protein
MPVALIQENGRFAAVGVSSCLIQEGGRFAAVVPNSLKETILIILKGGRFAAIVIFQLPNNSSEPLFLDASCTFSERRPHRGRT